MIRDLESLRFVSRADVYKHGTQAGVLRRTTEGVAFEYVPEYEGRDVATTLPRRNEPFLAAAGAVPPFFAGLLPEGRRLTALRQAIKTSADDELSLLLAVGSDAIGDVQIVPEGQGPAEPDPRLRVESFDEVRFSDLYSAASGVDRVALPGVQEKVSARMIALPVARRDARYILKLNPPEFPHLVENETFFLEAAKASGLAAATAEVVRDANGESGLLVQRFDRTARPEGGIEMLAQEDGCQVLGRYPADKYLMTGEEVVRGLMSVTTAPAVAARELVRQLTFAYLTCNGDAHAKNLSVIRDGEWRVTPFYDAPSSYPYGDHTTALSVGGLRDEAIGRETFVEFGASFGLPARAVEKALDDLCARSEHWLPALDNLPFDQRTIHKLRGAIIYRRDRLTARRA